METRFGICDKVYYFNAAEERVESGVVQGARIIGKEIHADGNGEDVCDEYVVLYQMKGGMVLTEREAFASEDECRKHYAEIFLA